MAACEVCGNDYERSFTVRIEGEVHTFDCFECAIHMLAPSCGHCGCTVIGHGDSSCDRSPSFARKWRTWARGESGSRVTSKVFRRPSGG